jgi:hypothetical protein
MHWKGPHLLFLDTTLAQQMADQALLADVLEVLESFFYLPHGDSHIYMRSFWPWAYQCP